MSDKNKKWTYLFVAVIIWCVLSLIMNFMHITTRFQMNMMLFPPAVCAIIAYAIYKHKNPDD